MEREKVLHEALGRNCDSTFPDPPRPPLLVMLDVVDHRDVHHGDDEHADDDYRDCSCCWYGPLE